MLECQIGYIDVVCILLLWFWNVAKEGRTWVTKSFTGCQFPPLQKDPTGVGYVGHGHEDYMYTCMQGPLICRRRFPVSKCPLPVATDWTSV